MRSLSLLVAGLCLLPLGGCKDNGLNNAQPGPCYGCVQPWPTPSTRDVDLLFVVDNSFSMEDEQALLKSQFPVLMGELRAMEGGLPNLHVGVTTTDLGTGAYQITYCEEVGGDAGNLVTGTCANPIGAPYIIDVEPASCDITMDTDGTCLDHACDQSNCVHEPNATFVVDSATGCPRCRNYSGESLEDVFSCIASVGTTGCGFEQPLEAMYKALDPSNTANTGFIRDTAMLGVVLISDEDDCSGSDPQLYDNTQTDLNSTLGPLTSYRCFEWGITCDVNNREAGPRQDCLPREDMGALLRPLSRYTQLLHALKDPSLLVVSAIAGPVSPSAGGGGYDATVSLDASGYPQVDPSCTTAEGGATPGIRLYGLVSALHTEAEVQNWAYVSVCADSYADAFTGVGQKIADIVTAYCPKQPFFGCADVGVEYGTPRAPQTCDINAQCLAVCQVTDVFSRGLPDEAEYDVPPCLEVAPDGTLLAGNTDRARAYQSGHPDERDVDLPVPACWHIAYDARCEASNYANPVISRKTDPPPRSFSEVACQLIAQHERLCNDQEDNDEDCLVDADDPDCQL